MKFNLNVAQNLKEAISTPLSVPVTESIKENAVRIKSKSKRNKELFNDLSRQFFEQLIEKFDSGEIEGATET